MSTYLRLVYSGGVRVTERRERVYPESARCFNCGDRFNGEAAKQITENDGLCNECAERIVGEQKEKAK